MTFSRHRVWYDPGSAGHHLACASVTSTDPRRLDWGSQRTGLTASRSVHLARTNQPNPSRPSVVHIIAPAPFGGAESVVTSLVAGQCESGWPVSVASLSGSERDIPFEKGIAGSGAALLPIRLPPRAYRREARELEALFSRHKPDLLHTHGFRADFQVARAARRSRIPHVSTVHGFTGGGPRVRVYEALQLRALKSSCSAVVAVSRPLALELERRGVQASRIHVIQNAWDAPQRRKGRLEARKQLGLSTDSFTLGWVGRVSAEKGCDVFVEAMFRVRDLPIFACIVGDGPDRVPLEKRTAELELADRIRWCGSHLDAKLLFSAFDGFVLSSRREGTPIALFEAMDAGLPLVVRAVGGVPDVVGSEEATLVTSGDPEALAKGLRDLYMDPLAAKRRARAARKRLNERFARRPWIERYERVYRAALHGQQ